MISDPGRYQKLSGDFSAQIQAFRDTRAEILNAVRSFVADDPCMRAGLFATVEIRPWQWSLGNPDTP